MENKRKCVYVNSLGKSFILEVRDIYMDFNGKKRVLGYLKEDQVLRDVPIEDCFFPYRNFFDEMIKNVEK